MIKRLTDCDAKDGNFGCKSALANHPPRQSKSHTRYKSAIAHFQIGAPLPSLSELTVAYRLELALAAPAFTAAFFLRELPVFLT